MLDLQSFWLTPNQSNIYQFWLQTWSTTVTKLARISETSRVLTYNTLQELIKKGYVSCIMKWNTGWYTMATPQILSQTLHQNALQFDAILPHLETITNKLSEEFNIQHFQWREGIKKLYLQIAQSKTDLKAYLGIDHIDEAVKDFLYNHYLPIRVKNGINSRSICSLTDLNEYFGDKEKVVQTDVRYIKDPAYDMDCEIILYDNNKISIASLATEELSGVLITSKRLYKSFSNLFDWIRKWLDEK
jgi:sugar-specific transcriptional regulator TrmB